MKKTTKTVKERNPFAAEKGQRRFGAGAHSDKKKESSRKACRGKVKHDN
tara:strand:+ start:453 stop:599 length:147 start_codon:yes stop_codon:yes gene_type:complete